MVTSDGYYDKDWHPTFEVYRTDHALDSALSQVGQVTQEQRLRALAPHQIAFLAYIDSLIAGLA